MGLFETFGEKMPVEVILTSGALYFGIDKVTDRMIKAPVDISLPAAKTGFPAATSVDEYIQFFINSFGDDRFTAQTGKVTVDGLEFEGETVTLHASAKQFNEAVVKLLEKVKAELAVSSSLSDYFGTEFAQNYEELLDSYIEEIQKAEISDSDQIAITVISENNVLRSFDLTGTKNEKKYSASFTTIEKDGTYTVKGAYLLEEKEILKLSYEQKPNDKNSADGELKVSFDMTALLNADEQYKAFYGTSELKFKFSGQKTDNRFSVNTKLEVTQALSGIKVTVPINMAFEFEKVSDSELKYSVNLSTNVQNTEFDITLSVSRKITDYAPVTVPNDSEVDMVDEFDKKKLTAIFEKVAEAYPGIGDFLNRFKNDEAMEPL